MRILLIADCYLPTTKSVAEMVHDLAVEFRRQGHEVIVAVPDHTLAAPSEAAVEDGVTVLRIRTGRIKGASKVVRAINEVRLSSVFWKTGKRFFRANRCDLVVFYSPTIFFGRLVKRLKKLWNCKAYLILRDIFPENFVELGLLKKGLIYWYFKRKERQQYAAADIIGVELPRNLQYFSEQGFEGKCRLEVLYNWTAVNGKEAIFQNTRERLGLQNKIVFFFGGYITADQDMDNIVRLAANVYDYPDIHFLLVGDGSDKPRLKAKIQKSRLSNISLYSSVPQKQYMGMLSEFDVGLVSLDRRKKIDCFTGKILNYMYSSIPVLASINPNNSLKHILEKAGAGFVCVNGDDDQFCVYALRLAEDARLRKQMGQNARKLLEKSFSATRAVSQILSHI